MQHRPGVAAGYGFACDFHYAGGLCVLGGAFADLPDKAAAGLAQMNAWMESDWRNFCRYPAQAGHTSWNRLPPCQCIETKEVSTLLHPLRRPNPPYRHQIYAPTDEPSPLKYLDEIVETVGLYPRAGGV